LTSLLLASAWQATNFQLIRFVTRGAVAWPAVHARALTCAGPQASALADLIAPWR
jgi:hypothetical protein